VAASLVVLVAAVVLVAESLVVLVAAVVLVAESLVVLVVLVTMGLGILIGIFNKKSAAKILFVDVSN